MPRPSSFRRRPCALLPLLLAVALAGCGGEDEGAPVAIPSGHERMVRRLAAIADEVIPSNRFLGERELSRLRRLQGAASGVERHGLLLRIAVHELQLGRPEEALATLAEAEALEDALPGGERGEAAVQRLHARGMAFLRLGETRNCIGHHTSASCLAPIEGDGVHVDQAGSRGAIEAFTAVLGHPACNPSLALRARWLLNLAAMTVGEYPDGVPERWRIPPEVFASEPFPRFPEVAAQVGLANLNLSGGAAVEDFDGDGLLDVLTSGWDYRAPLRLFRNRGDGRFEERGEAAHLAGLTGGLNLVHADEDGDGDVDVLVLRGAWFDHLGRHPNSLLRNDGTGRFSDVTHEVGLADPAYPTQAGAFADADGDGDLDLYLGNESTERNRHPSQLMRRGEDGRYTDVAAAAGVQNDRFAKGATWGDADGDGDPDLYVSNLHARNRLYLNEGGLVFRDVAAEAGVERPLASFATWFWDYDNDGALDLYCAAYVEDLEQDVASRLGLPHEAESGRLFKNRGDGTFDDVTERVGLSRLVTTMGANFGDLDGDGWLDLYLGAGYPSLEALVPNVMYRNVEGRRFADVTATGGFGHLQKGHGVAFADIDNDGDEDVFEEMGGAFLSDLAFNVLYENPGHGHHWVRLYLVGAGRNRAATGARVQVDVTEGEPPVRRSIHRVAGPGGSFGSNPLHVHVGLGDATAIERIVVRWPGSGRVQEWRDLPADRFLQLREGEDEPTELPRRQVELAGVAGRR